MTKDKLKEEFKVFFEKHPNIKELPFIMNIVIPKYECKGERHTNNFGEISEDEEYVDKYLVADYEDIETLWEDIMHDLPSISDKDSFYLFDENNLVVAKNVDGEVEFSVLDFDNEIWDMY